MQSQTVEKWMMKYIPWLGVLWFGDFKLESRFHSLEVDWRWHWTNPVFFPVKSKYDSESALEVLWTFKCSTSRNRSHRRFCRALRPRVGDSNSWNYQTPPHPLCSSYGLAGVSCGERRLTSRLYGQTNSDAKCLVERTYCMWWRRMSVIANHQTFVMLTTKISGNLYTIQYNLSDYF